MLRRPTTDVLVVGAGPAGLTAAYALSKARREVTVIEADTTCVGGISRTVDYNGFLIDIGGHRFFSKSQEIENLWKEILPDDFLDRPRLSRIYYKGRYFSYPLQAFEALGNLGVVESLLCLASYGWAKLTPIRNPRTFHDWVRNQFGERLFSIFFKTYTEKVWGISCDELSADWAAQRIKGLDLSTAILDAARRSMGIRRKGGLLAKTLIETFRYPRRGPGMMWQACAKKIEAMGGRIALGHTLVALSWNQMLGHWEAEIEIEDGSRLTVFARHVVSSAPLREVAHLLRPVPDTLAQIGMLKYRDFLIVALIGRPKRVLPDNWIYIHDPSVKVGRIQNFRAWSPEMVPDETSSCFGLEYFCFDSDGWWNLSDDDLIARAKAEIAQIGLMDVEEITDACVVRQRKAYPVYDDEYRNIVEAAKGEFARRWPTFHFVGRNGMHKYNNQDHAMMTGLLAARNIIAGKNLFDVWTINEDAEYSEAGTAGTRVTLTGERSVPTRVAESTA